MATEAERSAAHENLLKAGHRLGRALRVLRRYTGQDSDLTAPNVFELADARLAMDDACFAYAKITDEHDGR